jgi:MFS family permease
LLRWGDVPLRTVFLLSAIPGAIAIFVAVVFVKEVAHHGPSTAKRPEFNAAMGKRFWTILAIVFLFTLGNSTDAFLLLRAKDLGVPVAMAPILWAVLHLVKSASNIPGGVLSDRIGRRPTLIAGWCVYALVYFLFARATQAWHAWALFAGYGIYFGLTEGAQAALIADVAPAARRGSAYGWYNLAIGLGALPASLMFGALWDRYGAGVAFMVGAGFAAAAALALVLFLPTSTGETTAA